MRLDIVSPNLHPPFVSVQASPSPPPSLSHSSCINASVLSKNANSSFINTINKPLKFNFHLEPSYVKNSCPFRRSKPYFLSQSVFVKRHRPSFRPTNCLSDRSPSSLVEESTEETSNPSIDKNRDQGSNNNGHNNQKNESNDSLENLLSDLEGGDSLSDNRLDELLTIARKSLKSISVKVGELEVSVSKVVEKAILLNEEANNFEKLSSEAQIRVDEAIAKELIVEDNLQQAESAYVFAKEAVVRGRDVVENVEERSLGGGDSLEEPKSSQESVNNGSKKTYEFEGEGEAEGKEGSVVLENPEASKLQSELLEREKGLMEVRIKAQKVVSMRKELQQFAKDWNEKAESKRSEALFAENQANEAVFLAEKAVAWQLDASQKLIDAQKSFEELQKLVLLDSSGKNAEAQVLKQTVKSIVLEVVTTAGALTKDDAGNGKEQADILNVFQQFLNFSTQKESTLSGNNYNDSIVEGTDKKLKSDESETESPLEPLRALLRSAERALEKARGKSASLEADAQKIAERAFVLKDEATEAQERLSMALAKVEEAKTDELKAEESLLKAEEAFSLAEEAVVKAEGELRSGGGKVLGEVLGEVVGNGSGEGLGEAEANLTGEAREGRGENGEEKEEEVEAQEAGQGEERGKSASLKALEFALESAQTELDGREKSLLAARTELQKISTLRKEYQQTATDLSEVAERKGNEASVADEAVAAAMASAEEAVAKEVEAIQKLNDATIALQEAEKKIADRLSPEQEQEIVSANFFAEKAGKLALEAAETAAGLGESKEEREEEEEDVGVGVVGGVKQDGLENAVIYLEETKAELTLEPLSATQAADVENTVTSSLGSTASQIRETVIVKEGEKESVEKPVADVDATKETGSSKSTTKKSSRFFAASYFSSADDAEFSPLAGLQALVEKIKKHLPKIILALALAFASGAILKNKLDKRIPPVSAPSSALEVEVMASDEKALSTEVRRIPVQMEQTAEHVAHAEENDEETQLHDVLWLLLASVVFVPIFQKLPGGSPVLGYLAAGALIGPYALSIIKNVHGTKALAEFGVVFLMFNIGLELSLERLRSMKKYVFGLGTSQTLVTALVVGIFVSFVTGATGPAAIVIGNGLALSSTAVVLQVLQERGESTSRHGRATFSVLLFQDLAVVVLLILIPLISPESSKGGRGFSAIAEALALAAVKAVLAITGIIAGGRLLLRPIYKRMAENHNAEIFAANTLLVVLGTSVLTARAGLSMALGAFLAGLLLSETEYALQVESDIAPYRGLLLGLFFMTVGMSIDPQLLVAKFPVIIGSIALLITGKTALVAGIGRYFGLSLIAGVRAGLLLAPGGEFAFVAFGEAVQKGILTPQMSSLLFLIVGISMAVTPWLAAGGQLLASRFEQQDVRSLQPAEAETDDLQDHIIICGFGRVGQVIAQLLSERLIPFVALDVSSERVQAGRALDLPVYFGDAGSREILHKVGAERAAAAVITLDTPGANYRTVWNLTKNFPNVKTFVRAHDIDHGINLEKAGATAVVPETLEPSLQLAAAVLSQVKLPAAEIAAAIDDFRIRHLSELTELSTLSGSSLGYGFSKLLTQKKALEEQSKGNEGQTDILGAPPPLPT